jgi:3-phosphoshikimate 1-carboxyvinyltransferase
MIREAISEKISGTIMAPASKSVAQRVLAIAALAKGTSRISCAGDSDDVLAAIRVCRALGAHIEQEGERLTVQGGIALGPKLLDCGESGLGIRMFSAVAATLSECVTLTGGGSLASRPMDMIEQSLISAGASCTTSQGRIPIKVQGPLPGGDVHIDGSVSSQVLTGLLIAAPYAKQPTRFVVKDLKSRPYIDITTSIMADFGINVGNNHYSEFTVPAPMNYQPRDYTVEGDWSGAAFLLVAGAIGGEITVKNLNNNSTQADIAIMQALKECGAAIVTGHDFVQIKKSNLKGFAFDATHCPDLFPPLVALAAACEGLTTIKGVGRLKVKESDRAVALTREFSKLGLDISTRGDEMFIRGGNLKGARVHSHHDHRIAMAAAVASLLADGPVIIEDAQAIAKSYPAFYDDFEKIAK